MTTPIAAGYPDWGRRRPSTDAQYIAEDNTVINAAMTFPDAYVGDVPYVALNFDGIDQAFYVSITFRIDPTALIALSSYTVDVFATGSCRTTIPVRGPYMRVQVVPAAVPATFSLSMFSAANVGTDRSGSATENLLIAVNGAGIAAGVTNTYTFNGAAPGPANISALWRQLGAGWCRVYSVDFAGVTRQVAAFSMSNSSGPPTLYLPATPIKVEAHNSAAAIQTLDMSLSVPYFGILGG